MSEENSQSSLLGKIAAYTEILEKDPRSTIFVSLSEAYRKMGQLDDARLLVEDGLAIHPDFSPAYIVLARILCQQADYDTSDAAFSKALQLDENSLAGLVGYARLTALIGDTDKARNLLLKARSLCPADPVINKFLNSLPATEEEPSSVETEPQEISAPLISETLANLYMKQGLPDKALEIFRELLRNDPDNLKIRRLIREAELMLQGREEQLGAEIQPDDTQEIKPSEAHTDVDSGQIETPVDESITVVEEPTDSDEFQVPGLDPIGLSSVDASPEPELSPLGILNQWLDNIQKRRTHV